MDGEKEKDMKEEENKKECHIKDIFPEQPKPPKKVGHSMMDKRPHFKSFKSPGAK